MPPVHYKTKDLPPHNLDWTVLGPLNGDARAALGEYKGLVSRIPDNLLAPLAYTEAVASSRIEGTTSSLADVLEYRAAGSSDESTPKQADNQEVLNCFAAMEKAKALMKKLPLSERVLRAAHKILMQGVRGRDKDPGQYRRIQNWIGRKGTPIEKAIYVPCPTQQLNKAMGSWASYINAEEQYTLVQLAVMHAEFEAIHPFLDGNGRVGRLFIPLFLKAKGLTAGSDFYLAENLEQNRDEYYERLLAVSKQDDWTGWCEFFLHAIIEQAQTYIVRIKLINELYEERKQWMLETINSKHGLPSLDWIFHNPIFSITNFTTENNNMSRNTARRILSLLVDKKMLRETKSGNGRHSAILQFSELVDICEGRKEL